MNKFYVIIYHPSRFACIIHLNMLIYRYLNSVIDTSKTEISLTLSITIWGYPSRFSHCTLSDTAYHCWKACDGWHLRKVTVSWHKTFCFVPWKYVFFISDWEWDKFLSHKKKRLRIRNKQNVASCCDLHNHPKNSFGCKGTIFNRG